MTKYLLLLIMLMLSPRLLMAQNGWVPKGTLYADPNLTVEIEYLLSPNSCNEENSASYFRYRITKLGRLRNYYINWRFDFFDCNNELKTQLNSLYIVKNTTTGVITPELNSFKARKMSNYLNDVKKSPSLPEIGSYKPVSGLSMEPVSISGTKEIISGQPITLSVLGGSLAEGASWMWYEDDCSGKLVGTGASLTFMPEKTMRVFVRASNSLPGACTSTEVRVKQGSLPASSILGRHEICEGEKNINLAVNGGKLFGAANWVWYAGDCQGEKIGQGPSIYVSPTSTTRYYVRAEEGNNKTSCVNFEVLVKSKSVLPSAIEGVQQVGYGGQTTLKIVGGYLAADAKWVWFRGSSGIGQPLGTGTSISTGNLYKNETFSVRAEGECYQTAMISKVVSVTGQPSSTKSVGNKGKVRFFINGGLVFSETSEIGKSGNYTATVGGGGRLGWFVKAKFSSKNTKAPFQTDNAKISDYAVPGYYSYNGQLIQKRTGYTAGLFFGGYIFSAYLGGGYGTRDLLWGIDQFSYGNSGSFSTSFAKNTSRSFKGAEIDAGIMLRIGLFNISGGVSSIQLKYTDFNIGVGINL